MPAIARLACSRICFALLVPILMTACSVNTIRRIDSDGSFSIAGKIFIQSANQVLKADFDWVHRPFQDELRFFNPFGQQVLSIKSAAGSAQIDDGKSVLRADSLEKLMLQKLNFSVPLDWILDLLQNRSTSGQTGRVRGWDFRVEKIDSKSKQPRRIRFRRADAVAVIAIIRIWPL